MALVAVLTLSGGALAACGSDDAEGASHSHQTSSTTSHSAHETDSSAVTALHAAMRTLWAQHMQWTWDTVVAFAADSPSLEATLNRLLQNQVDIGAAVATYYGDAAGDQLAALLTTHIKDAVPVLTAAKAGDTKALDKAVADWYANAQDIGDFLAKANPAWKQDDMRQMMKGHITQTIAYASAVLGAKHADAVKKYDEAEAHMTDMADMLSNGIVDQFPDKF